MCLNLFKNASFCIPRFLSSVPHSSAFSSFVSRPLFKSPSSLSLIKEEEIRNITIKIVEEGEVRKLPVKAAILLHHLPITIWAPYIVPLLQFGFRSWPYFGLAEEVAPEIPLREKMDNALRLFAWTCLYDGITSLIKKEGEGKLGDVWPCFRSYLYIHGFITSTEYSLTIFYLTFQSQWLPEVCLVHIVLFEGW